MPCSWEGIGDFLKVLPGLALFPFTAYFAFKKIGYRVGCRVKVSNSRVRGTYISSIIFQNHKDRPIAIIEIFGIQGNVKFQIEEPKVPVLLKSLETIIVTPEDYSELVCRNETFEVDMANLEKLRIFVVTPEKTVECQHIYRPSKEIEQFSKGLDAVQKITRKFNNVVYGKNSLFAIVYSAEKGERTSIVDEHGFIADSDNIGCNHIPEGNMTPEGIKTYLKLKTGLDVQAFQLKK